MPSNYDKIRQDNIRRRGDEFDDIGQLLSEQLYSDKSHFVYELLQNAEDALNRRFQANPKAKLPFSVKFVLFEDRLEYRHFGQLFDEADVIGVSDVLKGTKREDVTQIGKFGIGFKSVYAFTATPEIYSGNEYFVIERYIRPKAKEPCSNVAEGETLFVFPFKHKALSQKDTFALILNKLKTLGPRVLLFLNRINEIEWSVECTGEKGHYLKETKNRGRARHVTVIGQNNGKSEDENWLIFERPVPVPDDSDQVRVEVGFRLEAGTEDKTESIIRTKDAPLVVYFPTEKATRFGFLIQGPYRTTPSRDNIPKDDDWNTTLVGETAHLLIDVLPDLKKLGLLTVSLLEALPIRMDDFPEDSMFYPIVVAVREALVNEDLLPADDGTFVSAQNAKLARGTDLRKLLNQDQLRFLFQSMDTIKWLTGEITQDRTPDLRTYLLNNLGVEEVTPDGFARKITESFLTNQDDDWFIGFYEYLFGQGALWRAPSRNSDTVGVLRAKPILRLEDNSLVIPFGADGHPNAYLPPEHSVSFPVIKRSIAKNQGALDFLKRLGLELPDEVAEVIENILPKYNKNGDGQIDDETYKADMQTIFRALKTDSKQKKERLLEEIKRIPFVKSSSPATGEVTFRIPGEVYLPTEDMRTYLAGNPDAWILCHFSTTNVADDAMEQDWLDLGVARLPRRIEHRKKPASYLHNSNREHTITNYHLYGLNSFFSRFKSTTDSSDKVKMSEALWRILCECIDDNDEFFSGGHKYFNRKWDDELFDADFVIILRSHDWLLTENGSFKKPCDVYRNEIHPDIEPDEQLFNVLEIKPSKKTIDEEENSNQKHHAYCLGIPLEVVEFYKQHPESFSSKKKPEFPERPIHCLEGRQERLAEQFADAPEKEYEKRERRVRTTRGAVDPYIWLKNQYTNDAGQMICQICKDEMPFKKPDGNYYFEKVESLTRNYINREHEAQFLALCPLCAAMFKEFVKLDDEAMKKLHHALMNTDKLEVPLKLGELETSLRFVERHLSDIKTILEIKGNVDG